MYLTRSVRQTIRREEVTRLQGLIRVIKKIRTSTKPGYRYSHHLKNREEQLREQLMDIGEKSCDSDDTQPVGEESYDSDDTQPVGEVPGGSADTQPVGEVPGESADTQPVGEVPGESADTQPDGYASDTTQPYEGPDLY
jgi:hypothetical protein